MKKLLSFLLISILLFSCSSDNDENASIRITTSGQFYVGDQIQFEVELKPSGLSLDNVVWESRYPQVASVSKTGLVTMLSEGTAEIKAEYIGSKNTAGSTFQFEITEKPQDYTSFIITIEEDYLYKNCLAGYYTPDGLCKKLGELGDISKGVFSKEIRVTIDTLKHVYFFGETSNMIPTGYFKRDTVFILEKNKKNIFTIKLETKGTILNKDDIYQYPH